ncbi:ornithine cyclodeaminase family protein [Caldivirga maquilingensis]|uniref:Ornithine cyclodeaminase n=1 Tax=Caldivirga maquilingensis (strain ATCC 700844 / DSM 13496 / JCM 10307 / IC-167) TaxID=397948 RepID=A8MDY4_CALMQ|nr:ornithine cyclodeaminase family protein [Caldivirga maquilingensis]ABW01990.1 Ornithine cyclodeaminase [Caldivirga maquilingensis IC-167]
MTLYIREGEVNKLLTYNEAIKAVEDGFRLLGLGKAVNLPRRRVVLPNAILHVLQSGVLGDYNVAGLKAYMSTRQGTRFIVLLFSVETGELLAIIEADRLGQIRTGAASVVASKYMANSMSELGIVGSGRQARAQFEAFNSTGMLRRVKVISRSRANAEAFASYIKSNGVDAVIVNDYREVCKVDVLVTATNSREPFIKGEYLSEGIHVNAIGSNWRNRAELAPDAVNKADLIAVDDLEQAKEEAGDLIMTGEAVWGRVVKLSDIVIGNVKGRENSQSITIFKSLGISIEDITVAKLIYDKAIKEGIGVNIEFNGVFNP